MSTSAERTLLVPFENRTVTVVWSQGSRTVQVPQENRTVIVVRPELTDRTVYATED